MKFLLKHKTILIYFLLFAVIYSLISLVNHYFYRTYALDLGAYTNALYDYIHFQWNDSTVFNEVSENLLADHFDLYLIIFSPFSLIFGTYTLLILQIFFLLLGGIGVYKYFNIQQKYKHLAPYASLYFYLFFGIYSALSFDYHSNVVAAALVPWFFYFVKKQNLYSSIFLLVVLLISKENMSLWLVFICLGLAFEYRKTAFTRNYLLIFAIVSGLYFVLITSFVMPALSSDSRYPHFHYSALGSNYSAALYFIITHPIEAIKMLFVNHIDNPLGDYVKMELHILLLLSGLPFLFKKPQYLLMLLPIFGQKLFHDKISMWGIGNQYAIEFAPIMAIGIFSVIGDFKNKRTVKVLSITILVITLASTIRVMDNTRYYTMKSNIRFYQKNHYERNFDISAVNKAFSEIPKEAIVCAQSPFLPHLALRDKIYQFPMIRNAEYIVYSEEENAFPLNKESFKVFMDSVLNTNNWKSIYDDNVIILKKK